MMREGKQNWLSGSRVTPKAIHVDVLKSLGSITSWKGAFVLAKNDLIDILLEILCCLETNVEDQNFFHLSSRAIFSCCKLTHAGA